MAPPDLGITSQQIEELKQDMFESVLDTICILDFEDRIASINNSGCELLACKDKSKIIGKHIAEYVHPEDREQLQRFLEILKEKGQYSNYRGRIIDGQGQVKHIQVSSRLIRQANQILGSIDIIRDVSLSVTMELELQEKNKILKKLIKDFSSYEESLSLDLELAARVQQYNLPPPRYIKKIKGFEFAIMRHPYSNNISGDYYNIRHIGPNEFQILLADTSGHGIQAAMSTMQLDAVSRSIKKSSPAHDLMQINTELTEKMFAHNFFTAFFAYCTNDQLIYSSAGHPPQYLIQQNDVTPIKLKTRGKPLGQFPNQEYIEKTNPMNSGDILFLYSDGLSEMLSDEKEMIPQEQLVEILAQKLPKVASESNLQKALLDFYQTLLHTPYNQIKDDLLMIAIRKK